MEFVSGCPGRGGRFFRYDGHTSLKALAFFKEKSRSFFVHFGGLVRTYNIKDRNAL